VLVGKRVVEKEVGLGEVTPLYEAVLTADFQDAARGANIPTLHG